MMSHHFQVSIPRDPDGFTSQECPSCHSRFKVRFEHGSGKLLSFCPYCGHEGRGCWWTPEQARYISAMAGKQVVGPMLDQMARSFNAAQRKGGFLKLEMRRKAGTIPPQPIEGAQPARRLTFRCCNEEIKCNVSAVVCVICEGGRSHSCPGSLASTKAV